MKSSFIAVNNTFTDDRPIYFVLRALSREFLKLLFFSQRHLKTSKLIIPNNTRGRPDRAEIAHLNQKQHMRPADRNGQ